MKKNNVEYFEHKEANFDKQGVFLQDCPTCKESNAVLTQHDNSPEYHTIVYTFCKCGEILSWSLPVN